MGSHNLHLEEGITVVGAQNELGRSLALSCHAMGFSLHSFIKMCIKSLEIIDFVSVTEHIMLESI